MSDDSRPPLLLNRNEDTSKSSLRSKSYGGPKPPDHSRDFFSLLTTSISDLHSQHNKIPLNDSFDASPTPISQSVESSPQQARDTTK